MATANQVSQLFVALYNRAIDATTAQKYSGQAYNAQLVNNIIADNGGVTETGRAFIERLYKNALGKNPSDDLDGINYWTSLAEGKQFNETTGIFEQTASQQPLSRGDTVLSFLSSVNAWSTDGAMQRPAYMNETQWATHSALARAGADVFGGKVTISNQAATRVGGDAGAANLTFDGAGGLESITKDNYKSAIENNLAKIEGLALRYPATTAGGNDITLGNPSQPSALPTAPDSAPEGYVTTTAADDTIHASIPQSGAAGAPTLQATTNIDAGAGYDTLYVDMGNSFEGFNAVNAGIKGVEKIVLTNTTHNETISFNALGIKDVYTYSIKGSNGINLQNIDYNEYLMIELDGVANTVPAASGNTQTGGTTSLTFNNRPAGGNLNLSLKNVGAASDDTGRNNHTVQFGIGTGSYIGNANGDVLSGIQMLNLAVSGRNYVDIANSGVTRITVTGTGDLDTNLSEGVNYFNAAAAAGNLIVRATDPKTGGNNATGVFDYFSTGEGNDKVVIDVSRLAQNAVVDLGADKYDPTTGNGGDRLTLTGQVDNVARTNTYNFNTIEHLVFNTTTKNAGDALLINLGTVSEDQQVGEEEVPQPDGTSTKVPVIEPVQIADRSADLKTITFQDLANVQLTGLGDKNLDVIYNGATADQKVLVDTKGTVNFTLNGADTDNGDNTTGNADGKLGQGTVNLSNAKIVNLDLTGQGFEGFLKLDNATTLNITNYTGDKKLKLKPNEANGNSNHLSSVETLTIDTTAKGDNANGSQVLDDSVDLRAATLPSLTSAKLIGVGGIQFGDVDTRNALTFDGSQYSGRLSLGNISAKKPTGADNAGIYGENAGTLNITTKGAISTGTLTGSDITIDLKSQIESADGLANNNIGAINITGESGYEAKLTYITGFSGTVYQEIASTGPTPEQSTVRTLKDVQEVNVSAHTATLTLDGVSGTDKFNIIATPATKSLTIKGSLGGASEEQKTTGDYDTVRIDLSKTSGLDTLDISGLQIDNPDGGLEIVASQGKANITLSANNIETLEFSAGGGRSAAAETYTIDFGLLRLNTNESFTLDGVTIVNTGSAVINGYTIADAIVKYVSGGYTSPASSVKLATSATTATNTTGLSGDKVALYGKFESLTGDWSGASIGGNGASAAYTKTLTFTNANQRDVKDLNLTWTGNSLSENSGTLQASTYQISQTDAIGGAAFAKATANATKVNGGFQVQTVATGETSVFVFNDGEAQLKLTVSNVKTAVGTAKTLLSDGFLGTLFTGTAADLDLASKLDTGGYVKLGDTILTGSDLKITKANIEAAQQAFASFLGEDFTIGFTTAGGAVATATGRETISFTPLAVDKVMDTKTITINQVGQTAGADTTIATLTGWQDAAQGQIVIDFQDLRAGYSYSFNGKTVIATKDLTGAQVANAMTQDVGVYDGVVVASDWTVTQIAKANATIAANGNTLTITDTNTTAATGITAKADSFATSTDPLLLDTGVVSASTTAQGQTANNGVAANSYVTLSKADDGAITYSDAFLTTIANASFDIASDKLALKKLSGSSYLPADIATGALSTTQGAAITNADGVALNATVTNGIVNFAWATASDAEITLEHKLWFVTHLSANEKVLGFSHTTGTATDTYVVATGTNGAGTTDDLVVKLAGISGVTDLSTILA